jgi:hypothetical protein
MIIKALCYLEKKLPKTPVSNLVQIFRHWLTLIVATGVPNAAAKTTSFALLPMVKLLKHPYRKYAQPIKI